MPGTCMKAAAAMALAGIVAGCNPVPGDAVAAPVVAVDAGLQDEAPDADPWRETPGAVERMEPPPEAVDAQAADAATRPFDFDVAAAPAPTPVEDAAMQCGFTGLPDPSRYRLYAAGSYGGRDSGFHIDRSGHEATRMDVAVNAPGAPVALMLGSYEPAVWSIGWTAGTRIVAVLVGGYHHQVLTGLPDDVPVIVSTFEGKGACGHFYVSASKPESLVPVARRVFERDIDMVYPASDGRVVVGQALDPGARLVTDAGARPPRSFALDSARVGGRAGLAYAVGQGWLREATQADAEAWQDARARHQPSAVPPVAGGRPRDRLFMRNAYVVQQAFELPPGLYGANSATFFIPEGVPRPSGNPGHSMLYDFNTLGCTGAACRVD